MMIKTFTLFVFVLFAGSLLFTRQVSAQAPQTMSYQAVIRDASGSLVTEQEIGMKITILQGAADGTVVYIETQTPETNKNGLVSIEIGVGAGFADIDWSAGPYFINTETDPEGRTNYTISGTNQLLTVPYALHAKTAETISEPIVESDPVFEAHPASDIEVSDIGNWNEAHSWGDHAEEGYLTEETDPSVPTGTQIGEMQYWDGAQWVVVAPGTTGQTLTFVNGMPIWAYRVSIPEVTNPSTGKIWMDRNLGASRAATSIADFEAYGHLYQWGRASDGHQVRTSGTTSTLSSSDTPGHGDFITPSGNPWDWRSPQNTNLWQGVNGVNNPCPSGYRLPTGAELGAERQSWSSNNAAGAFASPLKLSLAGVRGSVYGSPYDVGSGGYYWSSTADGTESRGLAFDSSNASMGSGPRADGLSVRCIKD